MKTKIEKFSELVLGLSIAVFGLWVLWWGFRMVLETLWYIFKHKTKQI